MREWGGETWKASIRGHQSARIACAIADCPSRPMTSRPVQTNSWVDHIVATELWQDRSPVALQP